MPDSGSWNLGSRLISVDFPLPDRPTIATVSPGATRKLIPDSTRPFSLS